MPHPPITLTQLLEMRADFVLENEPLVLMRVSKEMFEYVIESFVHKGRNWCNFPIPRYVEDFPTRKIILSALVEHMKDAFPDLKFRLCPAVISVNVN